MPHCLSVLTVNNMTKDSQALTLEASSTYNMSLAHHVGCTDKEIYCTATTIGIESLEFFYQATQNH